MLYHTYGQTEINVSAIGFGGMRFKDQSNVEACSSLVKAAYDAGINYFDTAPAYGKSEDLFGAAFKQMKKTRAKKPFYVSTKTMQSDPALVRKDLETSLKRMNLDHIDFYHVWCILSPGAYKERKANGVLKEFEKLKSEGLIKHICVSTHMTGSDIGEMLADYPFQGVLMGYSVTNFAYREEGLKKAAQLNRGVVVMNPLGGGIIPQNPQRFEFVKTRKDETVAQAALRFLLNDPKITIALVGFSGKEQIDEAVQAADGFKPIPLETVRKIRANLNENFNELCTSCQYCDECPRQIPIPKMMFAYNAFLLNKKPLDLINHIRYYWGIELPEALDILSKCTECGRCESACTQKLPVIDRIKQIHTEVEKFLKEQK